MVTPSWVRARQYKVYTSPTGRRTIVHFSPGPVRKKTTIVVPASRARNAVTEYLREHFRSPPRRRNANAPHVLHGSNVGRRSSPGVRARKNRIFPFDLNCGIKSSLYQNSTNNGRTGHVLTSLNNRTSNLRTRYNPVLGLKRIKKGMARLGSGKQGVVFLACTSPSCNEHMVIKVAPTDRSARKQISEVEYEIQKKVFKVVPAHIAVPYGLTKCTDFAPESAYVGTVGYNPRVFDYHHQYVTFSEYCPGGDYDSWMDKVKPRLRDTDMAGMIHQILSALKKIQTKYPQFRHNDLHLKNILVDDTTSSPRLVISDFGLARLTARGSNPVVNSNEFRSYGITSSTDIRYDSHLFLNALRIHLRRHGFTGLGQTLAFLDRAVPVGYRGQNDTYVHEGRLVGSRFPGLMTVQQLLTDPFLRNVSRVYKSPVRSISSPRVRKAIMNLVPHVTPASPRTLAARSPRTPGSSGTPATVRRVINAGPSSRNAANIARNALAGMPGVSVSVEGRRPTAAEFLSMTPRSRAALMTGTRGAAPRSRLPLGTGSRVTRGTAMYFTRPMPAPRPAPPPARSPPRAPAITARVNANRLLNVFVKRHNARQITKRSLKDYLKTRGYSVESAKREVDKWLPTWEASRTNLNEATRLAKAGVDVNARGYRANVAAIAKRRAALKLGKSPGGRIRGNKALLTSKKKEELVAMARRFGLAHSGKTKQQLVNALYG